MAAAIHDHVVRSTLDFDHPSSCLLPAAMIRDANNCPHTPESSDDDEGTTETPSPYLDPAANARKEPTRLSFAYSTMSFMSSSQKDGTPLRIEPTLGGPPEGTVRIRVRVREVHMQGLSGRRPRRYLLKNESTNLSAG